MANLPDNFSQSARANAEPLLSDFGFPLVRTINFEKWIALYPGPLGTVRKLHDTPHFAVFEEQTGLGIYEKMADGQLRRGQIARHSNSDERALEWCKCWIAQYEVVA
ncbi:hypothetical protein [Gluconobacter sphaericus]|uniref:Uncharacterized protein n=1 Tax=Gluconobacter sphaericus NBRC 12467 TaxID=1307951 RepID=A0AA37SJ86_9PROT|nr:hypothetical protein [Gluconobacter sphaericus]MBF0885504.1 hypothetical protein [Gluconobacter sphaericus]GBR56431.1 hypothetical protein AA12467_2607 [Gluconobacter sphaericus NBRC 12467]GEB42741.1 hypothetical protein GSP01_15230 [Gluconobacter sphaericus NBRC 12467]GLQ84717.1 hypothetical protein GCM10007872_16250 [Gluconobacter sphaericus NBRC 12467]GLQ85128.1 hypothetical protein GCM10007872_20360 [Gluconobacter sphaericus NBRC 12467]